MESKTTSGRTTRNRVVSKEITDMLKRRHAEQQGQRKRENDDPVAYATDKVEQGERRSAAFTADGTRRTVRRGRMASKKEIPPAKRAAEQRLRRQAIRKQVEMAQRATQRTERVAERVAQALVHAVKSAGTPVLAMGGGAVLVVLTVFVILIAAVTASPFGILFANESASADSLPLAAAVAEVNRDFNEQLEELQGAMTYDSISVVGETADWTDVIAVFAAKVAGADDGTDVTTFDAERIDCLKAVFWDMNEITSEVETTDYPDSDPNDGIDDSYTECDLTITLTPRAAEEMPDLYSFTVQQKSAMNELLADRDMLTELVGSLTAYSAEVADVIERLPDDLSPERRSVVETACSLVGKVTYFWGGKSLVLGWDDRWGTLQMVTAAGNSTSGTYRPYGLDCSGFVDWVFYNATDGMYYPGHGGGATMQHRDCMPIAWANAQPGDLVFYPGDEHVGIVGGWDGDGELRIIHCASSANGTVVTGVRGFTSIGRPNFY